MLVQCLVLCVCDRGVVLRCVCAGLCDRVFVLVCTGVCVVVSAIVCAPWSVTVCVCVCVWRGVFCECGWVCV